MNGVRHFDNEAGTYLGYPLLVTNMNIHVYGPTGRKLASLPSMASARRFVKGYRRATRREAVLSARERGN